MEHKRGQSQYPVRLTTEWLAPALEELARTVSERYGVRCGVETDGRPFQCNLTTATHLYRIAQEAVNNALKHGGGRQIRIRLARTNGELELVITDDGKGIKAKPERGSGMGLHIMDYRARSIGGSLSVRGDEGGTVVLCRVPLRAGAEREQT